MRSWELQVGLPSVEYTFGQRCINYDLFQESVAKQILPAA